MSDRWKRGKGQVRDFNSRSGSDGQLVVREDLDDRVVNEHGQVESESLSSDDGPELQLSDLGLVAV